MPHCSKDQRKIRRLAMGMAAGGLAKNPVRRKAGIKASRVTRRAIPGRIGSSRCWPRRTCIPARAGKNGNDATWKKEAAF